MDNNLSLSLIKDISKRCKYYEDLYDIFGK